MELILTKFNVPPRRAGWLPRPRLVARLEEATALVLLQAPAGYGKTTLLSEWARARGAVGWLSLDEADNDPARLVAGLAAAAGAADPGTEGPIAALVDVLAGRGPYLLVLDDAHLIRSRAALDVLISLAERLPEGALLAFGSRGGPELPWARWRARAALLEIGLEELRLSPEEAAAIVTRLGGRPSGQTRPVCWMPGSKAGPPALPSRRGPWPPAPKRGAAPESSPTCATCARRTGGLWTSSSKKS